MAGVPPCILYLLGIGIQAEYRQKSPPCILYLLGIGIQAGYRQKSPAQTCKKEMVGIPPSILYLWECRKSYGVHKTRTPALGEGSLVYLLFLVLSCFLVFRVFAISLRSGSTCCLAQPLRRQTQKHTALIMKRERERDNAVARRVPRHTQRHRYFYSLRGTHFSWCSLLDTIS